MLQTSEAGESNNERAAKPLFCKPELYYDSYQLIKNRKKTVKKAWRDWPEILTSLSNFNLISHGYQIPNKAKGKNGKVDASVFRIAVEDDDLDVIYGRTRMWFLYRILQPFLMRNWLILLSLIPSIAYYLWTGFLVGDAVIHLWNRDYAKLREDGHRFGNPLIWTFVSLIAALGAFIQPYFQRKQAYIVVSCDSQAFEQATREIWNAEQEKTAEDTVASAPAQTRVGNEGFDMATKMPPTKKVKYVIIRKFLTAALAMNIAVLHDPENDPNFEVDEEALASEKDHVRSNLFWQKDATRVQEEELLPTYYKLLRCRTATAAPTTLRNSVELKHKTVYQLFDDRQRGKKVRIKDDGEKLIDFSGIILAPEIVEIILSLDSSEENEVSGFHRHLRVLKHPITGEDLQMPTPEVEARLWLAANTMADHMVAHLTAKSETDPDAQGGREDYQETLTAIAHYKPPEAWSQQMKDEMPEMAEQGTQFDGRIGSWKQRIIDGFNKLREFMIPMNKHARLIGNPGPMNNMEDAMSMGPLENLMKHKYSHLITKKLTLDQCDETLTELLKDMILNGLEPESDDYSAMDSSWTLQDRYRLRHIAEVVLKPVREHLHQKLRNLDHVIDAEEHKKQIKWNLRYIKAILDPKDSILFSGERKTSLMNRWLVLLLEFAEDIRVLGNEEGVKRINAILDGTIRCTIGDGDDNLQGIPKGRYKNKAERICRFADMFKILDVCSGGKELTDCELLSRFHIWSARRHRYYHIGKIARNLGRLIAFKVLRPGLTDEDKTTRLSAKELAMICTDIWQRIHSLKETMFVRGYARCVFEFAYKELSCMSMNTVYSDDDKRLGKVDGDKSLAQCREEIHDILANTEVSSYAMVKVAHFKDFHELKPKQIKKEMEAWRHADELMKEAEIDHKHLVYPHTFFEDYPIGECVGKASDLRESCMDVLKERAQFERSTRSHLPEESDEDKFEDLNVRHTELSTPPVTPLPAGFSLLDDTVPATHAEAPALQRAPEAAASSSSADSRAAGPDKLADVTLLSPEEPPSTREVDFTRGPVRMAEIFDHEDIIHPECEHRGGADELPNMGHVVIDIPDAEVNRARRPGGIETLPGTCGDAVKTQGLSKSTIPRMRGVARSAGVGQKVSAEAASSSDVASTRTPSASDSPIAFVDSPHTGGHSVAEKRVLNLDTLLQAPAIVTSTDPSVRQAGGGGRGMARTNRPGNGGDDAERQGNGRAAPEVSETSHSSSPKTPTAGTGRVNGHQSGGHAPAHPNSRVNGGGSETFGAKYTDRRNSTWITRQPRHSDYPGSSYYVRTSAPNPWKRNGNEMGWKARETKQRWKVTAASSSSSGQGHGTGPAKKPERPPG